MERKLIMSATPIGGRPVFFCADLHIENSRCDTAGVDRMLDRCEEMNGRLVSAGDLLDAYIRDVRFILDKPENKERLFRIAHRMLYNVIGNHDSVLRHDSWLVGRKQYPFVILFDEKQRIYVEHGHLADRWAWVFKLLDKVDEKKEFQKIVRWILKQRLLSQSGRNHKNPKFRDAVIRRARFFGCSIAVAGHTHSPEIYVDESRTNKITYVNPGTALDRLTYAIYKDGEFILENF